MKINSVSCTQFAGVRDLDVSLAVHVAALGEQHHPLPVVPGPDPVAQALLRIAVSPSAV